MTDPNHMPRIAANTTRSEDLLGVLVEFGRCAVVMHDNPDPDAIAAGWAVQTLIEERLGLPVRLVGGGAIVRAENRHMVDLLRPPLALIDEMDVAGDEATILVDCGLGASNHLLTRAGITPVAVIDHHLNGPVSGQFPFRDIRHDVAASATIAAAYLREQDVEPGAKLATALLYAIRTETTGCETHHSQLDRSILPWLMERAEPALLAEIQNAPLSIEYFADLLLAIQNTFVYEDAALCFLPQASGAEIVGEVADLLIRGEGIHRVFCGAVVGRDLLVSVRTMRDFGNAAELLQRTLDGLGGGGGHRHRAGGKISNIRSRERISENLQEDLRSRWLEACNVTRKRGQRLVALREIVENL